MSLHNEKCFPKCTVSGNAEIFQTDMSMFLRYKILYTALFIKLARKATIRNCALLCRRILIFLFLLYDLQI